MPSIRSKGNLQWLWITLIVTMITIAGCTGAIDNSANETADSGVETIGYAEESATEPGGPVDALVLGVNETAAPHDDGNDAPQEVGPSSGDGGQSSLSEHHVETIGSGDSITASVAASLNTTYGELTFDSTVKLDVASNQAFQETNFQGRTLGGLVQTSFAQVDSYATPAGVYTKTTSDFSNDTTYTFDEDGGSSDVWSEEDVTQYLHEDLLGSADRNVLWTRSGEESYDGADAVRYVATGTESFDGFRDAVGEDLDTASDDETIESEDEGKTFAIVGDTEFTVHTNEATLLVDDDGLIRQFTYVLDGVIDEEPVSLRLEFEFTDFDETTVTVPDWIEDVEQTATEE